MKLIGFENYVITEEVNDHLESAEALEILELDGK